MKIRQLEDLLKMTKEENDKTIGLMSIMTAEQREQYKGFDRPT